MDISERKITKTAREVEKFTARTMRADGRSQLIYPTEKARYLKNSKVHIESVFYEWLFSSLNETEQQEFARLSDIFYKKCKEDSKAGFPDMTQIIATHS